MAAFVSAQALTSHSLFESQQHQQPGQRQPPPRCVHCRQIIFRNHFVQSTRRRVPNAPRPVIDATNRVTIRSTLPTTTTTTPKQDDIEVIDSASTDTLLAHLDTLDLRTLSSTDMTTSELITDMIRHLGDGRGMARLGLVDHFGTIGSIAVPLLTSSLTLHPNPVVRRSCGKALAKIADPSATDVLISTLLHDTDTVTRSSAAGALAKMGSTAIPKLLDVIADDQVTMTAKGHAAWAIAFMQATGDIGASNELVKQLQNDNIDVRLTVINALGAVAIGDALPSMSGSGSVDDWDEDVNENENENSDLVKKSAVESIAKALHDSSPEVRAEATTALANAGCIEFIDRIGELLDDTDIETKRCAALALMKLGAVSYIPELQRRVDDDEKGEPEKVKNVFKLAITNLQRNLENEDDEW